MTETIDMPPNKICGREECGVTNLWLCVGCLGDENNDYLHDHYGEEQ